MGRQACLTVPAYERAFVSAFPVARSSASTFAPELISIFCATTLPDKIAVEAKLTFMAAIVPLSFPSIVTDLARTLPSTLPVPVTIKTSTVKSPIILPPNSTIPSLCQSPWVYCALESYLKWISFFANCSKVFY